MEEGPVPEAFLSQIVLRHGSTLANEERLRLWLTRTHAITDAFALKKNPVMVDCRNKTTDSPSG